MFGAPELEQQVKFQSIFVFAEIHTGSFSVEKYAKYSNFVYFSSVYRYHTSVITERKRTVLSKTIT